ncbi:response regulator [Devosia sediminis]|uniref:Response regulator n=1 Tax=Devosia sediminis TaxID=2798801 RepID=A0A934IYM8_9HYPH|nr:response regulator [Devosia sediminis]MBJ3785500.1 response regulator [Devosia sediminis]
MTVTTFRDLRVLIGEDEQMLAMDLAEQLSALGAEVVGSANTVSQLEALAADGLGGANAVVLDIKLLDGPVFSVVPQLEKHGAAVVFCSGYQVQERPEELSHIQWLGKPAQAEDIARALCQAVDARRDYQID